MSNANKSTFIGKSDNVYKPVDEGIKLEFSFILDTLLEDNSIYNPIYTYEAIYDYVKKYDELNVVYYASITTLIYFNTNKNIYVKDLSSNIEKCALSVSAIYQACKNDEHSWMIARIYRFIIKLGDHISLAESQIDKIVNTVMNDAVAKINELSDKMDHLVETRSTELLKNMDKKVNQRFSLNQKRMKKFYKGLEKDSITILGIFVAIILAFIGSIVFPIELIENVSKVSIARLILLFSGISFIFINMLYLLIKFIIIINDKEKYLDKLSHICVINYSLLFIFILSLIITFLTDNIVELQQSVLDNTSKYIDNKTK